MVQIDMKMPQCCDECFALYDEGDYPFCLISQTSQGYTFRTREERMKNCPLKSQDCTPKADSTPTGIRTYGVFFARNGYAKVLASSADEAWRIADKDLKYDDVSWDDDWGVTDVQLEE